MPTPKRTSDRRIYQLKVTLSGTRPAIWRRLEVSGATTLGKLHLILQGAFGWTDSHLHQFVVDEQTYGAPSFDPDEFDAEMIDEGHTRLQQLELGPKSKFLYEYDFGDDWRHEITVEKLLDREDGVTYPRCTAGKRAGPPEDCGGISGYYNLLRAIRRPENDEDQELVEWAGGFDPEHFGLVEINEELKRIR